MRFLVDEIPLITSIISIEVALAVKAEPVYAEAAGKRISEGAIKGGKAKGKVGNRPRAKQNDKSRALAQAANAPVALVPPQTERQQRFPE
jgi:hypothetical protein